MGRVPAGCFFFGADELAAGVRRLLARICFQLERRLFGSTWSRPIIDATRRGGAGPRGRALFVYLALPFHLPKNHPQFGYHQSLHQALWIAEALHDAGYSVDVVDRADAAFRPQQEYDLILSHRVDNRGLEAAIGPRTIKVYLSSGANHRCRNREFRQRLQALEVRRGVTFSNQVWDVEDMPWVECCDHIVGFGNRRVMDTWSSDFQKPAHGFDNTGYFNGQSYPRDWPNARKSFIFLGSLQQIAKGLDVLLEAFSERPAASLHVFSKFRREGDFCAVYHRELFQTPNIHAHGWVNLFDRKFQRIAAECAWLIHPTCSEGSPGSVTNAMSTGLVPIISSAAGVDLHGAGFEIADCSPLAIQRMIDVAVSVDPRQLEEMSARVRKEAASRFTEGAFRSRWKAILEEIHAG